MKLAIVRQRYNPFGGAERFVERALQALAREDLHVTLITREWLGDTQRDVRICNPFHLGRRWRDASFARAVQQLAASGEFDLVQSHERIPGCDIFRAGDGVHATWLELRGAEQGPLRRLFTRLHPWHRYTLTAEAAMFRHPALRAVICNSEMVKQDIAHRFGVPAERLHVIHNGVDPEYFHPGLRDEHRLQMRQAFGIADDIPVVLFVGSGFARKGVAPLLQAMTQLADARTQAVIVGKDRHLSAMQKLAHKLGLATRVHFVGGQQDVRPWYAMADVLALPTTYDPFPNVVLEALACGLPVVTSTGSGAAEILTNPLCGGVVKATDSVGLAVEIERLLQVPSAHAIHAARAAITGLDRSDMAQRLQALYAGLLGQR